MSKTDILNTLNTTKPEFRNEFDAVVAVLHLSMKELGFRCIGLAESTSNSNVDESQSLPTGWNQSNDAFCFVYKHPQSSLTFIVKSLVLGDKLLVHGVAKEDNRICSLELSVKDYINEKTLNNYDTLYKDIDKLIALYKINIIAKFLPDLCKPGYEATTREEANTTSSAARAPPAQRAEPPSQRYPPPVYDPLRIPGTGNRPMGGFGAYPSLGVGYGDLNPPFPGMGGVPPGARGNLFGPDHPSFGPRVNDPYARDHGFPFGGGPGGPGAPGAPPRGTVPGARFDPIGPPAPSNPARRNNNFGDELPPPGFDNNNSYDNMYL